MLNNLKQYLQSKIVKDIINQKIGEASIKIFGFFLTIILARILTPEAYGAYVIAISFAYLLSEVIDLGVPVAMLYYLPKEEKTEKRKYIIKKLLYLQLFGSILILFVFFLFSKELTKLLFKNSGYFVVFLISLALSFIIALFNTFISILTGIRKFDKIRNSYVIKGISELLFTSLFAYTLKVIGGIAGFLFSFVTALGYSIREIEKEFKGVGEELSEKIVNVKKTLRLLFSLNVATFSKNVYEWITIIILSLLLGLKEIGFFRIAWAITIILSYFSSLQQVFAPRISKWDVKTIKRRLPKILFINFIVGVCLYVLVVLFGKFAVKYIYGINYIESYEILKILGIIIILNSISYFELIFNLKGKANYSVMINILSGLIGIAILYFLTANLGVIGAAIGMVIIWIIKLLLSLMVFLRVFNINS